MLDGIPNIYDFDMSNVEQASLDLINLYDESDKLRRWIAKAPLSD